MEKSSETVLYRNYIYCCQTELPQPESFQATFWAAPKDEYAAGLWGIPPAKYGEVADFA
jgi:hypothetical protein